METTIVAAIESLAGWAFSDSHVVLDRAEISEALQLDHEITGRYPSEEECEQLVCGDDEGEVPPRLAELFPHVDAAIQKHW